MKNHLSYLKVKKLFSLLMLLLMAIIFIPTNTFSQINKFKGSDKTQLHHEILDDNYINISRENVKTSPAFRYKGKSIFTTQVNVDENGDNIVGDAANEPSIAIDPTNPNRMVIGWRQFDDVTNNFRQAGYGYSLDGGQNWTFPGVIDPGVFRSDPVLDFDSEGNFYYNSLTSDANNNMTCKVYKIDDGGIEWDDGVEAQGGDKQWMKIDRTDGMGAGNNYSYWTQYWSSCYPGCFTRSVDLGTTFEDCVEISGNPHWGTLAIGPEGELYTAGAGQYSGVIVTKSTFAQNPTFPVSWDFESQVDLDGEVVGWDIVNPEGLLGQVWIDVDKSGGPGHGNVYVVSSVDRNSINDPSDVMFTKSTDGATSWSSPLRINNDFATNNYQWFGTMSVAPNGRIDVIWLDTRESPQGIYLSALYYSFSIDQGETWSENKKLSDVFDSRVGWPNQEKMGDYYDMISDNEGAHLAWANTLNGEQDVYYSYITPENVGIDDVNKTQKLLSLASYPNPFVKETTIRYRLPESGAVQIIIYDIYGKKIKTLVDKNQQSGIYNIVFDANKLSKGIYYCHLQTGNHTETISLALIK